MDPTERPLMTDAANRCAAIIRSARRKSVQLRTALGNVFETPRQFNDTNCSACQGRLMPSLTPSSMSQTLFPAVFPALLSQSSQAFARALGGKRDGFGQKETSQRCDYRLTSTMYCFLPRCHSILWTLGEMLTRVRRSNKALRQYEQSALVVVGADPDVGSSPHFAAHSDKYNYNYPAITDAGDQDDLRFYRSAELPF